MANNNLPALLASDAVKRRFDEVLGKNANGFIQNLLAVYNGNPQLKRCEPVSILAAAGLAATLNLSVAPSLGHAYIVPFGDKAQFNVGWKGLVQLAHRTGRYTALHAGPVFEGQIREVDFVTGSIVKGEKISDTVAGYIAFMQLDNGFQKTLYMTTDAIEQHALKYSKSYQFDKKSGKKTSTWSTNFDAMACKTVLKKLLGNYGLLNADLTTAIQADQSAVTKDTFTYIDSSGDVVQRDSFASLDDPPTEIVDTDTGEVVPHVDAE